MRFEMTKGYAVLPQYEVFALRYATNPGARSGHNFLGGDSHDRPMPLDYYVWLIRNEERAVVVDTGFDKAIAQQRSRQHLICPGQLLSRMKHPPDDVADVIITHLHYDHAGNHALFPKARYHIQDREMRYATGRCMCHTTLRQPFEGEDVAEMVRKLYQGRLVFHDGFSQLHPGIELHHLGGHTDGLQVVRVSTARGWVVLASDASHFYANFEEQRSFPLVYNVGDMLEGFAKLHALADSPEHIIPGHDPLVAKRYPALSGFEGEVFQLG